MRKMNVLVVLLVVFGLLNSGCGDRFAWMGNKNIRQQTTEQNNGSESNVHGYSSESANNGEIRGNLTFDKRFADDQMNEMNRMYGKRKNSNNVIGTHQNYHIELEPETEAALRQLEGIEAAYVVVGDHSGYAAIRTDEGSALSAPLEARIAATIRELHPTLERVYVSSLPEFVARMQKYKEEAVNDQAVQARIAEFNALVDRLLPFADSR